MTVDALRLPMHRRQLSERELEAVFRLAQRYPDLTRMEEQLSEVSAQRDRVETNLPMVTPANVDEMARLYQLRIIDRWDMRHMMGLDPDVSAAFPEHMLERVAWGLVWRGTSALVALTAVVLASPAVPGWPWSAAFVLAVLCPMAGWRAASIERLRRLELHAAMIGVLAAVVALLAARPASPLLLVGGGLAIMTMLFLNAFSLLRETAGTPPSPDLPLAPSLPQPPGR
ncbi:MAG: hypothetical protein ACYDAY_11685 [Candidatus Dormibacteria bacterium]